ncbi:MAG: glycosyltransferase family 9 protein [bacterium]
MQNWETLQPSRVKNILVIRFGTVAEILAATPLVRVLRERFPEARISFLLEERFAELLAGCPFIDTVISCHSTGKKKAVREFWVLCRKVRKERYDIVIDLQAEKRSRLLTFLSRAEFRIGYGVQGRKSWAYTFQREISPIKKHLVLFFLDLIRELIGFGGSSPDLSLFVAQTQGGDQKEPLQNIMKGGKVVLIHPGGDREAEVWPGEKCARLADRLIRECKAEVILAGSDTDADRERVGRISQLMSEKVHLAYHATLSQLTSLLKIVDVFVGNDSGPMHIAAAGGKRVVALFGPSDPRVRHPWGSGHEVVWHQFPCSPCNRYDCFKGAAGCMASIDVSEVLEAVAGFLRQT